MQHEYKVIGISDLLNVPEKANFTLVSAMAYLETKAHGKYSSFLLWQKIGDGTKPEFILHGKNGSCHGLQQIARIFPAYPEVKETK